MKIIIEVSKNSNIKYEYDKDRKCLILDRILHNTNVFPYNYGFIPNTLSPDGDPVDIIVLGEYSLVPGTMCDVKIIGGINTIDEAGQDDKIIAVLSDKTDSNSKDINDISDIGENMLKNIRYFLEHYKDNEPNKYIIVKEYYDKEKADAIIEKYTLQSQ
jgi:inorganic pyrophosphatase